MKHNIISSLIKNSLIPGNSPALASMVFDDLLRVLKFIHLASKNGDLKENFLFTDQISYLDEVWHNFILHTKLYYDYCLNEFGEIIHHTPESESIYNENINPNNPDLSAICRKQMNLMSHYEGLEFTNKIFIHYPLIFNTGASHE